MEPTVDGRGVVYTPANQLYTTLRFRSDKIQLGRIFLLTSHGLGTGLTRQLVVEFQPQSNPLSFLGKWMECDAMRFSFRHF